MNKRNFLNKLLSATGISALASLPSRAQTRSRKDLTILETGFSTIYYGRCEKIFNTLQVGQTLELQQDQTHTSPNDKLFNRPISVYHRQQRLGDISARYCTTINQMLARGKNLTTVITGKHINHGMITLNLKVIWQKR